MITIDLILKCGDRFDSLHRNKFAVVGSDKWLLKVVPKQKGDIIYYTGDTPIDALNKFLSKEHTESNK